MGCFERSNGHPPFEERESQEAGGRESHGGRRVEGGGSRRRQEEGRKAAGPGGGCSKITLQQSMSSQDSLQLESAMQKAALS